MFYLLQDLPTHNDLLVPAPSQPMRVKATGADGIVSFKLGCGVCDKPLPATEAEYYSEVIPVCASCEEEAAWPCD